MNSLQVVDFHDVAAYLKSRHLVDYSCIQESGVRIQNGQRIRLQQFTHLYQGQLDGSSAKPPGGTKTATKCGVARIGATGMAEHFGLEKQEAVYQKAGQR